MAGWPAGWPKPVTKRSHGRVTQSLAGNRHDSCYLFFRLIHNDASDEVVSSSPSLNVVAIMLGQLRRMTDGSLGFFSGHDVDEPMLKRQRHCLLDTSSAAYHSLACPSPNKRAMLFRHQPPADFLSRFTLKSEGPTILEHPPGCLPSINHQQGPEVMCIRLLAHGNPRKTRVLAFGAEQTCTDGVNCLPGAYTGRGGGASAHPYRCSRQTSGGGDSLPDAGAREITFPQISESGDGLLWGNLLVPVPGGLPDPDVVTIREAFAEN